jgi:hypothetical protein
MTRCPLLRVEPLRRQRTRARRGYVIHRFRRASARWRARPGRLLVDPGGRVFVGRRPVPVLRKASCSTTTGTPRRALKKQFEGTFIDTVPGVDGAWVIIGVLELAVFALMLASLAFGEFLPHRRKALLIIALCLALLVFACLSFGQTTAGNNEGTASLYTYFASTAVILLLVVRLPPNSRFGAAARVSPGRRRRRPTRSQPRTPRCRLGPWAAAA